MKKSWCTIWLKGKSLYSLLRNSIISIALSITNTKRSLVIRDGSWILPRSNHVLMIFTYLHFVTFLGKFTSMRRKITCEIFFFFSPLFNSFLLFSSSKKFKNIVLKFRELFGKQRQSITDRIFRFEFNDPTTCPLCKREQESHAHFFFNCD